MAIIDISLMTGYIPVKDSLDALKRVDGVSKIIYWWIFSNIEFVSRRPITSQKAMKDGLVCCG